MRWHWVLHVLLVTVTLADYTDWRQKRTEIRPITPTDSVSRLLRLYESSRGHEEERGVSAPAVETVVNSLKSASTQLDEWLAKGKSTDDVFKHLTLDVAVEDLLGNSKLTEWITT
ncbi:secreted RxLR effector peptide protein, putative [Phytophthora infestans T30-4]|uniref:RxLR effector protein n=1 Tax=Phytophthora infestans (strain T30-4) TaxID=403677 RepID=D0NRH7_PHYIT|nr:secreted RxLR effector peptide protein, putative [Phytophthora infestans T30-4]EEY63327.1 secreted RxLR effector peptide protein, putative [Phytophthora infestans T30-4]|eukprot:XP_002898212.1 secreted RxLR effector peptide protein, putative [Phytophthora infestans T30-4]